MRNAGVCDDVAERAAVKRLPINDPGDTGLVVRQSARKRRGILPLYGEFRLAPASDCG